MLIKNDNIYLIGNYIIYIFTTKGEFLNQIKSSYIEDVTERNGVLYVQLNSRYDEYEYKYIINEDTMEIENIHDYISIPVDIEQGIYGDKIIMGDDEYDIYFRGTIGLYGYNKSDEKTTLLVDWQNSDIYEPIVSITSIISPDKIICAKFRDFSRSTYQIFDKILILNKVPDEDVVPKILLTMPLLYDEDFLLMLASEFNMVNDKYRIVFTDYSKYINRQEPGIQYDKFNLDLTTGKIPDIILVNQYLMPVRSYLSKGLFTDLYTFYLNEQR